MLMMDFMWFCHYDLSLHRHERGAFLSYFPLDMSLKDIELLLLLLLL